MPYEVRPYEVMVRGEKTESGNLQANLDGWEEAGYTLLAVVPQYRNLMAEPDNEFDPAPLDGPLFIMHRPA